MDTNLPKPLTVDVFVDVVCPWCFVGKRRLEAALALAEDVDASVVWRPFQLDPTIPAEGLDRAAYMAAKFGAGNRLEQVHAQLAELGRPLDIYFDFDAIKVAPNTLDAHRLIAFAAREGFADEAVDALISAYFAEGRDLSQHAVLADIAEEIGMDRAEVLARLGTDEDRALVEAEIRSAGEMGVTGVPFYVLGNKYGISGAQEPEMLADALRQVAAEVGTA